MNHLYPSGLTVQGSAIVLVTVGAVIMIHIGRKKKDAAKRYANYMYPPLAPVGIIQTLIELSGTKTPWFFLEMARKSSSDVFRLPIPIPGGLYIVCNPAIGREILSDDTTDKPEAMYKGFNKLIGGPSIFTRSNNPKWKAVRRGTAHAFSSSQISRMNHICAKHVDRWMAESLLDPLLVDAGDNSQEQKQQQQQVVFDPSEEMTRLTFKALAESAFEYIVTDEEYKFFTYHVKTGSKEFVVRRQRIIRKLYAFLDPSYWEAVRSCKEFQTFGQKVLDAYRNNPNKSSHNTLIKLIEESKSLKTDREKVIEINVWMLAGYDTTGWTLANTVVLLAKHPRVAEKLQRELSSMEPEKRAKSTYLRWVMNEAQRILPITASGSARVTGRDFEFHHNYNNSNNNSGEVKMVVVPRGSNVVIPFLVSHRTPSIFKDPDDFYPERWENEDKAMRDALIPFSVGMRNCPGQSLAMAEMLTALTRLLTDYKLEVEAEGSFQVMRFIGTRLRATRIG